MSAVVRTTSQSLSRDSTAKRCTRLAIPIQSLQAFCSSIRDTSQNTSLRERTRAASLLQLDKGYFSEYFSERADSWEGQPETSSPEDAGQQVTAILKTPGDLDEDTFEIEEDGPSTRPTLEQPVFDEFVRTRRRESYRLIVLIALISLLLVGATGYFFYSVYLKPKPAAPVEEPAQ